MTATRGVHAPGRDELDRFYTQPALALAILRNLDERPSGRIIEPSVGAGSWVEAARQLAVGDIHVTGVDLDPNAAGLAGCDQAIVGDWAQESKRILPDADWVIGNPPFRHLDEHVRASLEVGVRVVMLVRLGWLCAAGRQDLFAERPPRQLLLLSPRPSFTGGSTDSADYAAVYWSKADVDLRMMRAQRTTVSWLNWRTTRAAKAAA